MKFIIAKAATAPGNRNVFKMVLNGYWGDMDEKFDSDTTFKNDPEGLAYMELTINAIRKFKEDGCIEDYRDLEKTTALTEEEKETLEGLIWGDQGHMYPYFDFTLTYIDNRGIERAVTIED